MLKRFALAAAQLLEVRCASMRIGFPPYAQRVSSAFLVHGAVLWYTHLRQHDDSGTAQSCLRADGDAQRAKADQRSS